MDAGETAVFLNPVGRWYFYNMEIWVLVLRLVVRTS